MNTTQAQVRFAELGEAETIAKLSRDTIEVGLPWRWQPVEIERFIRSNRHNVIVAHEAGLLVGFAVMGYGDEDAYLALLAVLPSHRRHGIAKKLLAWLLKTADVAGLKTVSVELREDNLVARDLYLAAGFVEHSRKTGGYYGRVNQVRMRHQLRSA